MLFTDELKLSTGLDAGRDAFKADFYGVITVPIAVMPHCC